MKTGEGALTPGYETFHKNLTHRAGWVEEVLIRCYRAGGCVIAG